MIYENEDTFAYCNAKCLFCSYHRMTRKKGKMSRTIFETIVDEMKTWKPVEIVPIHYGEFFLNPDWQYILNHLDDNLPGFPIAIPTNSSMIDENVIEGIINCKNLKYINFSIYAYFPATYEKLIGLPFETINKVRHTINEIHCRRPDIIINVGSTFDTRFISEDEQRHFKNMWGVFAAQHEITFNSQHGIMTEYKHTTPCISIFQSMMVLWDGRVCLCCYDDNGEVILGDMNNQKLLDIWNGIEANRIRKLHESGMRSIIPLCKTCSFGWNR